MGSRVYKNKFKSLFDNEADAYKEAIVLCVGNKTPEIA